MKNEFKLKLLKRYSFKVMSKPGLIVLALIVVALIEMFPEEIMERSPLLFTTILLGCTFLSKFPHEYLHTLGARMMGVKTKDYFAKIADTSKYIQGMISCRPLLVTALSPLFLWGAVLCCLLLIPDSYTNALVRLLLIIHLASCTPDVMYSVYAFKYRNVENVIYVDKGDTLLVMQISNPGTVTV